MFDRRIARDVDEDGDGSPGIDEVFADENALGDILWGLGDNQGTIRDIAKYDAGTDTTTVVNHLKYDAFGKITSQPGAAYEPRFTYTSREWDADAEMYYYRSRWYDAAVGQFASEDWIGFAARDPNLSRYVGNSPTNYTDPSGRFAVDTDALLGSLPQAFDAAARSFSDLASGIGSMASFFAGAFCDPSGSSEGVPGSASNQVRLLSPAEVADLQDMFAISDDELDSWLAHFGYARDLAIEKLLLSGPHDWLMEELRRQQQPPPGGVYYPVPRYRNHQIVGGIGGELRGGGGSLLEVLAPLYENIMYALELPVH